MAAVTIAGAQKYYGEVHAVRGIDLEIASGEFAVLVGPSGCGKTTLLRMIAGLEDIDGGTIRIGDRIVNDMRPRERDIAMVFQSYALYPYMTVFDNIAFGLRARKTPEAEVETRVKRAAAMLGVDRLLERYPRQLSGGQRQRVAIGRAIVRNAQVFLFDEPLSNLDAQLRDEMRGEIKRLHQDIGKTVIYVTHDQIEAMTLADRMVLLNGGVIEQVGKPLNLFERPASRFVAGFLGSPRINFLEGAVKSGKGTTVIVMSDGTELPLPTNIRVTPGKPVIIGIRPEHISVASPAPPVKGKVRFLAKIELVQPTGSRSLVTCRIGAQSLVAELPSHDINGATGNISIDIDMGRAVLIDGETDRAIARA
ncbi:ABC transporter ATP-binding protein [Taklimakanibacter deserti]|uniref:ABC transporter ATP-binding protein n=1 Tax=Taklimakanibacter deserti TaxID=2267839 RepID=UPI000E65CA2F